MIPEQNMVRDFHIKYHLPTNTSIYDTDQLMFRIRLIIEETAELVKACSLEDMTNIIDALGDLLYVTYGMAVALGVDMDAVFREIHRSNMTKSIESEMDGKVIKGNAFEPPDIEGILKEQGIPC